MTTLDRPKFRVRMSTRTRVAHASGHIIIIVVAVLLLYPLLWMIVSAFKPSQEIFTSTSFWPQTWTIENFTKGWTALGIPFSVYFLNSFVISILSVIGNLFSCTLAAYAFARLEFRFRGLFFAAMLATIMLPFQVVMVPQYILFHSLGWTNTFLPLIVPKFLAVDAFFIFLMVQFIRGLPRELDDAAKIDGCGPITIFWRVILPLTRPALAVTAVFTFIWTWNDFLSPLLYLTNQSKYTLPIALNSFLDATGAPQYGPMFAMSLLSLVPLFVIFLLAQRQLVRGIATTGLK